MINLGSDNMHAWTWDTPGRTTTSEESGTHTHTLIGPLDNGLGISNNNRIEVSLDKNLKAIKLLHVGSSATGKDYRLTVFFK